MSIDVGFNRIFGNLSLANPTGTIIVDVINNRDVVVGELTIERLFNVRKKRTNIYSFEFENSGLFIGFDQSSKLLKLGNIEEEWEVSQIGVVGDLRVVVVDRPSSNECWTIDNLDTGKPIELSALSPSRPPKQKWIFVWIR